MKTLLSVLVIAVFTLCGMKSNGDQSNTSNETPLDSGSGGRLRVSSIANLTYGHSQNIVNYSNANDDTLQAVMLKAIDEVRIELTERSVFSLSSDYSGYENSSSATYYFDSLYSLTYCTIDWSMEGNGGSSAYYFRNDRVIAGTESNDYMNGREEIFFHAEFNPISGYKITSTLEPNEDQEPVEDQVSTITSSEVDGRSTDAMNDFQGILGTLRENIDSVLVSDQTATFHREETANYGEDFTSTQDFTMDVAIFDHLIKK